MSENPSIYPLPNGPYVFKEPRTTRACASLTDEAGRTIPNQPYLALCRCGGSKSKPFCDGSHLTNGFRSEKAADRTPDRRRDYPGKGIVVHDNRALCSHGGQCTGRLSKVFREHVNRGEPWIEASGLDAEAIIEVVKKCPSGALSYSVESVEHRDRDRPARIVVSPDGPYQVEGGIELIGEAFGEGASREHYCLCRCGASKNKPFCDGSHWKAGFRG